MAEAQTVGVAALTADLNVLKTLAAASGFPPWWGTCFHVTRINEVVTYLTARALPGGGNPFEQLAQPRCYSGRLAAF